MANTTLQSSMAVDASDGPTCVGSAPSLALESVTEQDTARDPLMTVLRLIRERVPEKPYSAVMTSTVEYVDVIRPVYFEAQPGGAK